MHPDVLGNAPVSSFDKLKKNFFCSASNTLPVPEFNNKHILKQERVKEENLRSLKSLNSYLD